MNIAYLFEVANMGRNLYISAIAVYSYWQKSKYTSFPPTSLAFASLLLIPSCEAFE